MHELSQIGANQGEWNERDLRRSVDFHALLLAMAGHDLRQNLQIILSTYGWLSAFHRLEVTQSDGLGLGLFVVSRAVELLQHQLEVRSIVGRGSCSAVLANAWSSD
jgi:hypothetical protein